MGPLFGLGVARMRPIFKCGEEYNQILCNYELLLFQLQNTHKGEEEFKCNPEKRINMSSMWAKKGLQQGTTTKLVHHNFSYFYCKQFTLLISKSFLYEIF